MKPTYSYNSGKRPGRFASGPGVAGYANAFVLYAVAFVVLLLVVVAQKGASSFLSRVQRLDALRVSLQSEDPARELLDDPAEEIALIEDFLFPSADRHDRAVAYYNDWRSKREWLLSFESVWLIDYGATARVTRALCMVREGRIQIYSDDENWVRHEGVWYLKDDVEELLREYDAPPRGRVLPEPPSLNRESEQVPRAGDGELHVLVRPA